VSANSPASKCSLGSILIDEKNDEKAKERGVELLKKSAASEYPEGQYELACCQWNGEVVQQDQKSAVELWKKAANNGLAAAQCEIGQCYEKGEGCIQKDMKQAEKWYLKASEGGDSRAQFGLGRIYEKDGEMKDIKKAIEWYEKAYYNGESKEVAKSLRIVFAPYSETPVADLEKALEWAYREGNFRFTAFFLDELPDRKSFMSTVKGLYRSEIHRTNDNVSFNNLAHECKQELQSPLYRRAAVLGCSYGMYLYARDLPDQHPKKLHYIRKSAEDADPLCNAQWELGEMYETGRCGLEKNPVLAKEWKDKALANGYKE
jgi:TPR repeat protein